MPERSGATCRHACTSTRHPPIRDSPRTTTALRPLDWLSQLGNGTQFTSAVTTHTIWFHRPLRTDRWLLLRQHSPLVAHGRSFGRGDILTEDGVLVASYAREALLRIPN